jgi:hypothetical protein
MQLAPVESDFCLKVLPAMSDEMAQDHYVPIGSWSATLQEKRM